MTRGAVHNYQRGNISGELSRDFNAVESDKKFQKIEGGLEDALEVVRERYAKKFFAYYRKRMKEHNFSGHDVKFSCGMGVCNVMLKNRRRPGDRWRLLQNFGWRRCTAFNLLEEIEQSADWSWGAYLDGQLLTENA